VRGRQGKVGPQAYGGSFRKRHNSDVTQNFSEVYVLGCNGGRSIYCTVENDITITNVDSVIEVPTFDGTGDGTEVPYQSKPGRWLV
jgi:hypothetical protein